MMVERTTIAHAKLPRSELQMDHATILLEEIVDEQDRSHQDPYPPKSELSCATSQ
jgi:hypothetical protein